MPDNLTEADIQDMIDYYNGIVKWYFGSVSKLVKETDLKSVGESLVDSTSTTPTFKN